MKRFVLGDVHGGYKALLQCFERSKFNYDKDELIVLGDVCDGWQYVYECVEELMKVKNLIYILGNHDAWALDWFLYSVAPTIWTSQGGANTIKSYNKNCQGVIPKSHIDFFKNAVHAYVDEDESVLFVHGGIDLNVDIKDQDKNTLLWDRDLIENAVSKHRFNKKHKFSKYKEIFVGHTTTFCFRSSTPIFACNVIDLDTGGGYEGKLTIMNRDTKEYYQSDKLDTLYPGEKGR